MSAAARPKPDLMERIGRHVDAEARAFEPLAPKTSMRVGGPAELFIRPRRAEALVQLLAIAREEGVPVTVLGGGANTLVGDGGIAGVVVKLPPDLAPEQVEGGGDRMLFSFGAGAAIVRLINQMRAHRRVGAEFLAGIPGSLGGAVAMNAGTKMGECGQVLEGIELATPEGLGWVSRAELDIAYRRTSLPAAGVVTRVRFALPEGDPRASEAAMEADLNYRKRTQPMSLPNCGSVFQNPPGNFAGRLIEQAGLKGQTAGRAQISTLHANWIVNLGGATAADVVALIELAQARVRDQTGIELVPEVKRAGSFHT